LKSLRNLFYRLLSWFQLTRRQSSQTGRFENIIWWNFSCWCLPV